MAVRAYILAGGYSTRTRELGIEQKALAYIKHPWTGEEDYLINHQIKFLKQITPESYITVVVGHKGNEVVEVVKEKFGGVNILWDRYVSGIGMVWKQIVERHGAFPFLSLNVDNLHGNDTLELLRKLDARTGWVFAVNKRYLKHGSGDGIKFDRDGYFLGFDSDSKYVMSGLYFLHGRYVDNLYPPYKVILKKSEFKPVDVYEQFLKMKYVVKVAKVRKWYDCGNPTDLGKLLVKHDEDIGSE